MGKPSRDKGAQAERDAAKALGWKRGRAYSGEPDIYAENGLWVGSVKCRKAWQAYIDEAIDDAEAKAGGAEPIVILMRRRKGAKPRVLICHTSFDAWLADHGEGKVR